jgi:hypothetical protein
MTSDDNCPNWAKPEADYFLVMLTCLDENNCGDNFIFVNRRSIIIKTLNTDKTVFSAPLRMTAQTNESKLHVNIHIDNL